MSNRNKVHSAKGHGRHWSNGFVDMKPLKPRESSSLGFKNSRFAQSDSNKQWQNMLRPEESQPPSQQRQQYAQQPRQHTQPTQPRAKTKQRRGSVTMFVLPKGWSTAVDGSTGKTYYYHATTRETSWEHPGKMQVDIQHKQDQAAKMMQNQRETERQVQQMSAHAMRGAAARDHRQVQQTARRHGGGGGGGGGGGSRSRQGNIFDRLTDSSQYTGAHKHRFDQSGKGRGLAGRDRVMKGTGYVSKRTHEGRSFVGNTNTGTNQIYHDSSQFLMRR